MNKKFACAVAFILFIACVCLTHHTKKSESAFAEENKCVYLTFDDGPSDRVTPKILKILKEKEVKATFFVVGKRISGRANILKEIVENGHSVGIHSYSHDYKEIYSSKEKLLKDIYDCDGILRALDIKTKLYRFPGGSDMAGEELKRAVKEAGFKSVDWNALCGDSEVKNASAKYLYNRAISSAKDKNRIVMLFHDATDKLSTAHVLPDIIDHYKALGYEFKALDMG